MARSLKKGPFADESLLKKIDAMNASNDKQVIISTQSVELLNEFEVQDVLVVDRGENGSDFKRLNEDELRIWLENDYALGDLWQKNLLGGRLSS